MLAKARANRAAAEEGLPRGSDGTLGGAAGAAGAVLPHRVTLHKEFIHGVVEATLPAKQRTYAWKAKKRAKEPKRLASAMEWRERQGEHN